MLYPISSQLSTIPSTKSDIEHIPHFLDSEAPLVLVVKNPSASAENVKRYRFNLGWEDPPEKGKATHSTILAWRVPWTEESGGLQSLVPPRVEHN